MEPRYSPHLALIGLLLVYVTIGALYAALTPIWQVPDEPAHYNYIRALAEDRGFPVIEQDDYDQAYLGRLTAEKFPPELPIEPLEYEDHQPPLYYLLATPVYLLFDGAVIPLRLLSVLFGAGVLAVAFGTVGSLFPTRPRLALMTAALIAFIPQHVAMTAGVNNDTLAELIVGANLWALVAYADGEMNRPWRIGLLLTAALLTKTTAYVVIGVAVAAVALRWQRERHTWKWAALQLAWMIIPALLLSAPWFIRNGLTYGWRDPLGLNRHNAVVVGQPRTSEWLAEYGWKGLLSRMMRTTFQSFWGQFGWMGVVLPARIYQALMLFTAIMMIGFILWLLQQRCFSQSTNLPTYQSPAFLLACSAFLTFSAFAWYNLAFVQHQGRYLFPALIPIGAAAALGLDKLAKILPRRWRHWALSVPFLGLALLDVYCLFKFVIPFLTR